MHMHGLVPAAVSLDGYHVQHACMHSLDLVARLLGAIAKDREVNDFFFVSCCYY